MVISTLHNEAMDLAEKALFRRRRDKDEEAALPLFEQALHFEMEAIKEFDRLGLDIEPTRSVLHRSAATLAVDCGQFDEARELVAKGLAGNPPPEIADELREVLENIGQSG